MKNILCKCTVCSQPIECEPQHVGHHYPCPYCGMDTLIYDLNPPSPEPEAGPGWLRRNWKLVGWVTLGLAAVAFLVFLLIKIPQVVGMLGASLFSMAILVVGVCIVVMWVLFPIVVYFQLESVIKLLRKIASK